MVVLALPMHQEKSAFISPLFTFPAHVNYSFITTSGGRELTRSCKPPQNAKVSSAFSLYYTFLEGVFEMNLCTAPVCAFLHTEVPLNVRLHH